MQKGEGVDDELRRMFVYGDAKLLETRVSELAELLIELYGEETGPGYRKAEAAAQRNDDMAAFWIMTAGPTCPKFWSAFQQRCASNMIAQLASWMATRVKGVLFGERAEPGSSMYPESHNTIRTWAADFRALIASNADPYGQFEKAYGTLVRVAPGTPILTSPKAAAAAAAARAQRGK